MLNRSCFANAYIPAPLNTVSATSVTLVGANTTLLLLFASDPTPRDGQKFDSKRNFICATSVHKRNRIERVCKCGYCKGTRAERTASLPSTCCIAAARSRLRTPATTRWLGSQHFALRRRFKHIKNAMNYGDKIEPNETNQKLLVSTLNLNLMPKATKYINFA